MQINLEQEYQEWLKKMKLDESKMGDAQKRETKRAFFGGISTMIICMVTNELPEEDMEKAVSSVMEQVARFWAKELNGSIDKMFSMFLNEKKPD